MSRCKLIFKKQNNEISFPLALQTAVQQKQRRTENAVNKSRKVGTWEKKMNRKRTRQVSSGDKEANSNVVKVRQRLSGNGEPITFQWYTTRNGNLAPLYKNNRYYKYKKHHQPVKFAEHALYMCNENSREGLQITYQSVGRGNKRKFR